MSTTTTNSGKINWTLALALVVALIGTGIIWQAIDWYNRMQGPRFAVSAIDTLTGENAYEVTNYLLWFSVPTSTLKLNLGLEVRPTYSGEPLGEVQVLVKNRDGEVVAHDSWKSLNKGSGPIQLLFNSDVLGSMVDAQQVPYKEDKGSYVYPTANLLIEVSKVSDSTHPLYTDTLKILDTPWYHFSRAVPNFINGNIQTVDVFVKGRNLGAPSEFMILAEVYEITDTAGRPFNPWPKLNWVVKEVGKVERDTEFATSVTLPSSQFRFEPGKCYAVKTFAIKKQNYVEFQGTGWKDSDEAWRFGDWEDFALVCFPTR